MTERDEKVLALLEHLLKSTIDDTIYAGAEGLNGMIECLHLYGIDDKTLLDWGSASFFIYDVDSPVVE
jgi:hypothetical protein